MEVVGKRGTIVVVVQTVVQNPGRLKWPSGMRNQVLKKTVIGSPVRKTRKRGQREKILRGRRERIGRVGGPVKSIEKAGMSLESMGLEGAVGRDQRGIGAGRERGVEIGTEVGKEIEVGIGIAVGTGREGEVGVGIGTTIGERTGMIVEVAAQASIGRTRKSTGTVKSPSITTEVIARIVVTVDLSVPKSGGGLILIPGAEVPHRCHAESGHQATHLRGDPKLRRSGVVRVIVMVMVTVRTRAVRSLVENTSLDHHQGGKLFLFYLLLGYQSFCLAV